ncbi:hypothetical protein ABIF65_003366 [Bradyrhizobium japonicum]|jgi:hypothetical protein|uniref:DUF1833 family protein n=1 Tax=Bradyrhizobium TaxID=374 RepID=UPI0004858308|nr:MULTISPECIES: DUF1833 family protein [Bradyrhizobium]MBR0881851.1 DUF1833 family protein [Bradyrhizobium liaoningense]MBR0940265.1 DUF1833 family protein [Bradyrhizobium liaoningense]MBR1001703.1 DUF1833 family protein [Bradyrhizobium liaoningense]MBR1026851.1 DUF1833 family protein [Bradyrhizobium liaoningense]MBR1065098.1 DUF1833 family protein [Bradyrhizobium liaoningense]
MPTHNEALLEAYASCPPGARVYYTLEIWQSSFDQPARVVANVGDDMALGIEVGAPRNGGETVTFIACPFEAKYPEQREGQPPSTAIKIDNVGRELVPKIRAAQGVREYISVLYREYLGSDLTEPAYGPVEFELRGAKMVGNSLTGTVMVKSLQNKRFPRITKNYDYVQFPSLLPT